MKVSFNLSVPGTDEDEHTTGSSSSTAAYEGHDAESSGQSDEFSPWARTQSVEEAAALAQLPSGLLDGEEAERALSPAHVGLEALGLPSWGYQEETKWPLNNLVVVKNVPARYTLAMMIEELQDGGFQYQVDFTEILMPYEGLGMADNSCYINFFKLSARCSFIAAFDGRVPRTGSGKTQFRVEPASALDMQNLYMHSSMAMMIHHQHQQKKMQRAMMTASVRNFCPFCGSRTAQHFNFCVQCGSCLQEEGYAAQAAEQAVERPPGL